MPDLVPPEIEKLRDCATRPDGGSLTQFEAFIPLADAEAAVLACERRMDDLRYRQQQTLRRVLGEIGAVLRDPAPDDAECVAHIAAIMANGPLDDAPGGPCEDAVFEARQRTVAEIVEWLRTDNPDNPRILTTFRVAEMIEQRFGAKKEEDDGFLDHDGDPRDA